LVDALHPQRRDRNIGVFGPRHGALPCCTEDARPAGSAIRRSVISLDRHGTIARHLAISDHIILTGFCPTPVKTDRLDLRRIGSQWGRFTVRTGSGHFPARAERRGALQGADISDGASEPEQPSAQMAASDALLDSLPRLSDHTVKPCEARPWTSANGFTVSASADT
jgi:hypothetical protein